MSLAKRNSETFRRVQHYKTVLWLDLILARSTLGSSASVNVHGVVKPEGSFSMSLHVTVALLAVELKLSRWGARIKVMQISVEKM